MSPANAEAWDVFCAVSTQWRSAGFGLIGLDYGVLFQVAAVMGVGMSEDLLDKIQALEREEIKKSVPHA